MLKTIVEKLKQLGYFRLIWIIPFLIAIHEYEEIFINKWYLKHMNILMSQTQVIIGITGVSLVGFIATFISSRFKNNKIVSAYIISILTMFFTANAILHIYWTIIYREYAPGIITALLLIIPSSVYFNIYIIKKLHTKVWFPITSLLLFIFLIPRIIGVAHKAVEVMVK